MINVERRFVHITVDEILSIDTFRLHIFTSSPVTLCTLSLLRLPSFLTVIG